MQAVSASAPAPPKNFDRISSSKLLDEDLEVAGDAVRRCYGCKNSDGRFGSGVAQPALSQIRQRERDRRN
jgi:hypothetical protein